MAIWTPDARRELERHVGTLRESGASEQAVADLRRRLDEAVALSYAREVTPDRLRGLLEAAGPVGAGGDGAGGQRVELLPREPRLVGDRRVSYSTLPPRKKGPGGGVFIVLFGVLLPAFTVLFELITGACAEVLVNPIPTPWHVALALAVPACNGAVWWLTGRGRLRRPGVLGLLNGLAIGVGLCYALLFLPVTPFAAVAVLFFGFGLIPLSPLLSLIAAVRCCGRLHSRAGAAGLAPGGRIIRTAAGAAASRGVWAGVGLAALLLLALQAPAYVTHHGLRMAAASDPERRARGVAFLRDWGSENEMLRACYWGGRGGFNGYWSLFATGGEPVAVDAARAAFYRVTGAGYETRPRPASTRAGWEDRGEGWDEEGLQGGEVVGALLPGLSLASSRLDGTINPEAATAYTEWTMVFRNDEPFPQEARARVALPAGGVVSRLTLWINGEEREAAFGSRGQVRAAYENVVKVQRRDPVLVTTAGPGRVQVQCFPVPAGGTMKVRMGVTAPLRLAAADAGAAQLPCLLDRNFAVQGGSLHAVWVESTAPLGAFTPALSGGGAPAAGASFTLRGQVSDAELCGRVTVTAARPAGVRAVWMADPFDASVGTVVQRVEAAGEPPPRRVVLALDGSATMGDAMGAVADALERSAPAGVEVRALVASDDRVAELGGDGNVPALVGALRKVRCRGGQDSVPLLTRAWDLAGRTPGAVVLWVHGPQPVLLDPAEPLVQRLERQPGGPRVLELQPVAGPNGVLDALSAVAAVDAIFNTGHAGRDLRALFGEWSGKAPPLRLARHVAAAGEAEALAGPGDGRAGAPGAVRGDIQVVRLWAQDEVLKLAKSAAPGDRTRAAALAVKHQLVTPVSGAVVLETQQQYDANGLTPVSAVPLPPAALAVLLTLPLAWLAWRRARPGAA